MASDAVVNLIVDATGADNQINVQLRQIVNEAERNAPAINLTVNIDRSQLAGLSDGLRDVGSSARGADDDSGRLSDTFRSVLSAAAPIASIAGAIGGIGVAAGGAVPLVAGLVQSLANIAPAAAAGVTAFIALKAASATLKLGLTGVEDALKAVFDPDADPEAVAEALERLAPEARKFVLALQDMKPAFDELRLDVQNRLFKDFDTTVSRVAKSVFPEARAAALSYADSFNTMGKNVAGAAVILDREGTLGKALKGGTDAFKELEDVPGQVVLAIGRLGAAGAPLLNRFADAISNVVDGLSTRLADASESGALEDAVNAAGDALAQLGRIAGNVFGILGNVLGVADTAGGGLFATLESITQMLEDATATQGFQDALGSLIDVAGTLAANVLPLVGAAFEALGPILDALDGPVQIILNTLGTELINLLPQAADILALVATAIGSLLTALVPLIPVAFQLIQAILPVLPPLFQAVNDIIVALTPVIEAVAVQLAESLVPIIQDLIPIVTELITFLAEWVEATAPLAEVWLPVLVSLLLGLTSAVTNTLNALLPLITVLFDVAITVAETVVPALIGFIGWVEDTNATLSGFVNSVINGLVLPALRTLGDLLTGDFSGAWNTARDTVVNAASRISQTTSGLRSSVTGHITSLGSSVISSFSVTFRQLGNIVSDANSRILGLIGDLGSRMIGRLTSFHSGFFSAGASLISGFVDGILSQLSNAVSAAARVVSSVADYFPHSPAKKGAFSGRGWTLFSGRAVVDDFAEGIAQSLRSTRIDWSTMGSLSPLIPSTGGATPATDAGQAAIAGMFGATFARITPSVNVYLGNSLLTDHFQVMIDGNNQTQDRIASQGVRF